MRKISEMYQRSGGSAYQHTCGECQNLKERKRGSKTVYKCDLYHYQEETPYSDWKKTYIACKYFNMKWEEAYPETIKGQMSVLDYPEWMP